MSRISESLASDLFAYPNLPGWKSGETSRDAAKAVGPKASAMREAIFDAIGNSPRGLTADEASAIAGCKPAYGRPRVSELHALGKIASTGERRRNPESRLSAMVWRVT